MYCLRQRYRINNYIKGDKMRQSHKFLEAIDMSLYRRYLQQLLMIVGFILFSLGSSSAFAADNPGATCEGIAGASQGRFADSDYTNLATAVNTSDYIDIAGNASGSIPLQIKMTITEQNGPPSSNSSFSATTVANTRVFNIFRNFPSMLSVTSVDFDFRNKITEQPIFLTNVALSAFDIDYANSSGNIFDDYVLFTGVTKSGKTIDGTYRAVTGSSIRPYSDSRPNTPGTGLYTLGNTANCPISDLDTVCQGSVQFSEPVQSVKVRYSNANFRIFGDPTNQEIHLRIDNYCYVPQYIFSGTVFDDNGGIPAGSADKDNADIMTPSSVYANRSNYFNGLFNPSQELGISGSTVRLVNCAKTNTTYAQSVIGSGATIGQYQFSVPISTFDGITNLCIVEERAPNIFPFYPIRTTTDNLNTGFAATKYNYPNNNFGRVIPANAALVLEKEQAPNNCNITSLTDSSLKYSKSPLSSSGDNPDIRPGQCIAYRITATNRANMPIDNFIMQDALQKKDANNATVTSVLTSPAREANVFNDGLINGQNGTIRTISQTLPKRNKRLFYFNTKYGNTMNAQ